MKLTVDGEINNVYIYISDSLRYDYSPEELASYGSPIKTASSSTNTCTSFPSMITGLYPPQHGVWTFSGLIQSDKMTIFDCIDGPHPFYYAPRPVFDSIESVVHYAGDQTADFLDQVIKLDSPFLILDRDNLPHLPYGFDSSTGIEEAEIKYGYDLSDAPIPGAGVDFTSVQEYFRARRGDTRQIEADYQSGVEHSVKRFASRIGILREFGLLEDTLVIFTADHGEELGEYGRFTHGESPVPETIYVPTVFYLENGDIEIEGDFMAHVDLLPTIAGVFDKSVSDALPGHDLLKGAPENRMVFSAVKRRTRFNEEILEWGAWDHEGGHVFSEIRWYDLLHRIVGAFTKNEGAAQQRRRPLRLLRGEICRRNRRFGTPRHEREEAASFCRTILSDFVEGTKQELNSTTKDRLRALGYTDETIE
jgi:hypothetical protein